MLEGSRDWKKSFLHLKSSPSCCIPGDYVFAAGHSLVRLRCRGISLNEKERFCGNLFFKLITSHSGPAQSHVPLADGEFHLNKSVNSKSVLLS